MTSTRCRPERRGAAWITTCVILLMIVGGSGVAARDLTDLSLEELMNIEVTTVSKKPEKRWEAAAALYVITQQDIRRSGVTNIPDALRMAPGVHVAQIDSNKWAVSVRGFSGRFTDKLLVLMDGRSVYTPLFAGVYWDVQDTLLEDIDRIEVVRGPGGSLWGANAVNGVINVITKSARETQGTLVSLGGGDEERRFGAARYGGKIGDRFFYRAYVKYFDRDDGFAADGSQADGWDMARVGFRSDWDATSSDKVTFQGDYYKGDVGSRVSRRGFNGSFTSDVTGGNLLGRWTHRFGEESDTSLQIYYDRTERREIDFGERRDTIDLDAQHHFSLPFRQNVVWGLGYRLSADAIRGNLTQVLSTDARNTQLFSGFAQDEITLVENRLRLTLGVKLVRNDYSGFEVQPSSRLLWTPSAWHTLWGAVSRAVRTPSRAGHEIVVTLPLDPRAIGGRSNTAEKMLSYELGYRVRPLDSLSFSLSTFYNDYTDLSSLEPGEPFFIGNIKVEPVVLRNMLHGNVWGVEVAADWVLTDWWNLHGAYSYLAVNLRRDRGSQDPLSEEVEHESPQNQLSVRSYMDLPAGFSFDTVVRYTDSLPVDFRGRSTPSYLTVDARLAWQATEALELSIVGRNLAEDNHQEFHEIIQAIEGTRVQRSVYGKVRWEF